MITIFTRFVHRIWRLMCVCVLQQLAYVLWFTYRENIQELVHTGDGGAYEYDRQFIKAHVVGPKIEWIGGNDRWWWAVWIALFWTWCDLFFPDYSLNFKYIFTLSNWIHVGNFPWSQPQHASIKLSVRTNVQKSFALQYVFVNQENGIRNSNDNACTSTTC